jgi:hypothetical protein
MSTTGLLANLRPCTGLIVGPVLWAVSTQLGPIWPALECGASHQVAGVACFGFACLALASGIESWRSRALVDQADLLSYPRSTAFVAGLGSLAAAMFTYVLILQGAADLVLDACQR